MTLTSGRGPLGPDPAGVFHPPLRAPTTYVEPHPRRIVATVGESTVIDTERAVLVHRPGHPPRYAFPPEVVGALPATPEPAAPGFVVVPWDAADQWSEEGRRLVHYPPNPYHRIDIRPTRRHLRVEVGGLTLVDTDDTIVVFETALAPVLYVHPGRVRTEPLHRSGTTTYCNYKGWATHWSADVDGTVYPDVAWSYDDPPPEGAPITGCLAFDTNAATVEASLPEVVSILTDEATRP